FINYPVYDKAKFSIFLVADLNAIEPIYGNTAYEYSLLEAGAMAQLLRMTAPKYDLGLCPIGQIDSKKLNEICQLSEKHIVLHTLLAGIIDPVISYKQWSF